eukprot:5510299-Pyramimonas_sp.AAC.1
MRSSVANSAVSSLSSATLGQDDPRTASSQKPASLVSHSAMDGRSSRGSEKKLQALGRSASTLAGMRKLY